MRSPPGSGRTWRRHEHVADPSRHAHGRGAPDGRRPRALARLLPRVHRPRRARAGRWPRDARRWTGRACSSSSRSRARSPRRGGRGSSTSPCCCPTGRSLARWLAHAVRERVRLSGASDHFVSEAIYLSDPDKHGIEIYHDRPRELWEGQVAARMGTDPLDLNGLLGELDDPETEPFERQPDGTTMGHVHLQVADIPSSVEFYRDLLGFGLMAEYGGAGGVPLGRRLPPPRGRQHLAQRRSASAGAGLGRPAALRDRAAGRGRARRAGRAHRRRRPGGRGRPGRAARARPVGQRVRAAHAPAGSRRRARRRRARARSSCARRRAARPCAAARARA